MATPSLDQVPHLIKITDHHHAEFLKESVADLLDRSVKSFPGAQPVSFARKHLRELEERDYFLAEKTDGIRLLLYLTQLHDGREAQFFIDRKNDYYHVEPGYLHIPIQNPDPRAPKRYIVGQFNRNTLVDGELVLQRFKDGTSGLTYLMFDCLAFDGTPVMSLKFDDRIAKIHNKIIPMIEDFRRDWPEEARVQPFELKLKKQELAYGIQIMLNETIPKLPHGNDGLIFTCKETPYKPGTDEHILKWKPPHENTIDFMLQLGSFPIREDEDGQYEDFDAIPEIQLLVNHGSHDGYRPFDRDGGQLHLTPTEWEAIKGMGQQIDWRIIECYREKETGHWRPKIDADGTPRFRDDKRDANHISVVDSVLESIEDAVTEQELTTQSRYQSIRNAWKERAKLREQQQRQQEQQKRQQAEMEQKRRQEAARQQAEAEADDGPTYEDDD
ncbi:hypothetical protein AC578_1142 [Pseudocercospora eumusae]|uniref:mRNA-capping enzyme subunit alpha n=1 Tax=Pseudocercospora eumusae TaxID=321146 RepID=A0A139HJU1_9PEZI|nr:hypothetical protein AC578_1142 [Pseudocercospora eumusae]